MRKARNSYGPSPPKEIFGEGAFTSFMAVSKDYGNTAHLALAEVFWLLLPHSIAKKQREQCTCKWVENCWSTDAC